MVNSRDAIRDMAKDEPPMIDQEKTFCSDGFDGTKGCRKMTISKLYENGTHYICSECGETKWKGKENDKRRSYNISSIRNVFNVF